MNDRPAARSIGRQEISEPAYQAIRDFIYRAAGINLGPSKQMLVSSRLNTRLAQHGFHDFDQYVDLLNSPGGAVERQVTVDLLTTNETYFFREAEHFKLLRELALAHHPRGRRFRLWSAASSSGEEAYSIAMVLDDYFGQSVSWEIFGSDVSSRIVRKAREGLYLRHRIDAIPPEFLKRYCLKGSGEFDGYLLIDGQLRSRTRFAKLNLIEPLPDIGRFEAIFLRNVLIYFDSETKEKILHNLLPRLRENGLLFIGHSESLKNMNLPIEAVAPTVYRKT